ncbi:helix-turn-helix domain-containing protein [Sphingobacterium cellulitidis]|uniref:helix-turn-helix domain-containing protein n=1 Tax=Sphingobacterium cellulitidis TaxID=1768011 RepID=UPI0026C98D6C
MNFAIEAFLRCHVRILKTEPEKGLIYPTPESPKSIGDHIRNKRMELKLLQEDVAKIFDVSEDYITNWEKIGLYPKSNRSLRLLNF